MCVYIAAKLKGSKSWEFSPHKGSITTSFNMYHIQRRKIETNVGIRWDGQFGCVTMCVSV